MLEGLHFANALDLLSRIDDGGVDLIVTDPPYGVRYHSNYHKGGNPHDTVAGDDRKVVPRVLREFARVLKPGGAAYIFTRWDVYPDWTPHLPGLKVKNLLVWVKNNHSAGDLKGDYGRKYELILFAVKGRHLLRGQRPINVLEFPRIDHTKVLHPVQKPVELVEFLMEKSSDAGDLVFDPFVGTGTTVQAAMNLERRFLACDVDPAMCVTARDRLGVPLVGELPVEVPDVLDPIDNVEHPRGLDPDECRELTRLLKERDAL